MGGWLILFVGRAAGWLVSWLDGYGMVGLV